MTDPRDKNAIFSSYLRSFDVFFVTAFITPFSDQVLCCTESYHLSVNLFYTTVLFTNSTYSSMRTFEYDLMRIFPKREKIYQK